MSALSLMQGSACPLVKHFSYYWETTVQNLESPRLSGSVDSPATPLFKNTLKKPLEPPST